MNNNTRKNNKFLMIVIAILVVIICLLLLKDGIKKEKYTHQGKINIFEIKCDVGYGCDCEQQDDKLNDNSKEVINVIDDNAKLDINVLDNDKTWQDQESINIFSDSTYVVKGKVAPESLGTYQFVVKNSTKYNVRYTVKFNETNDYHINMKYKLKKNNEYIIGDWVTFVELAQTNIRLNSGSNDTYYLEWKWFGSYSDNSIGNDINSKYGLSIDIRAVQVDD